MLCDWLRDDAGLGALWLTDFRFDSRETDVLAEGLRGNATLKDLRLCNCQWTGASWRFFARVFSLANLSKLSIQSKAPGWLGPFAQAFRFAQLGPTPLVLRSLDLFFALVLHANAQVLADGLRALRSLTVVSIGADDGRAFAVPDSWCFDLDALAAHPKLKRIDVDECRLTQEMADGLARLVEGVPKLKALCLTYAVIKPEVDLRGLARAMKRLQIVEFGGIEAAEDSWNTIVASLRSSSSIVEACFDQVCIDVSTARLMAAWIRETTSLRKLHIFLPQGGQLQQIVNALEDNQSVAGLWLTSDEDPGLSLRPLLRHKTIETLYLRMDLSHVPLVELTPLLPIIHRSKRSR